jgi:hypothetical protein
MTGRGVVAIKYLAPPWRPSGSQLYSDSRSGDIPERWTSVLSPEGSAGSGRPAASVRTLALVSNTAPSAAEGLAKLTQRRASAQVKVDQLEAEQRAASTAREAARVALIHAEREGASSAQRAKLERALDEAEARASQRWPERVAGATARVRDCERELQNFAAQNLHALVEEVEARGDQASADEVAAAGQLLSAYNRREEAVREIGALVALAGGRVHPSDVGPPSRADAAAAACRALTENGESAPRLRRYPDEPRHGVVDSAEAVPA